MKEDFVMARKQLEANWLGLRDATAEICGKKLRVNCAKGTGYQNGQILMEQSLKLLHYSTIEVFTGGEHFCSFSPGNMAFLAAQISR